MPTETVAEHTARMKAVKAAHDARLKTRRVKKGLVIVHTGHGKGKSSSGFGMILRCIAHEMPCGVVQFIKGSWESGERKLLRARFARECEFVVSGEGFTWETQDRDRDTAAAAAGWEAAKRMIRDTRMRFVLLDEINIALRYGYLDIAEVVAFLRAEKPTMTHVCLTGRDARPELIAAADLVTEMTEVKHPFETQGVIAQRGTEY